MRFFKKMRWAAVFLFILLTAPFINVARAATTPSLGAAASYGVLANTYANPVPGTTINGDIGFSTGPAVVPAGAHPNYGSGAPYSTAGADRSAALAVLNGQACTFTFAPGTIDFATDTTHGPMGIYTPGVYCINSTVAFAAIGASGITLSGNGTFIFRINGSLITAANSAVTLTNGASACDVFWNVTDNAITSTLGADSTFSGTLTDNTRLAIHNNVSWVGRALIFDGTVSTDVDDTITVPSSCTPPPPATATLHVIKVFYNDYGGTAIPSDVSVHVRSGAGDVAGSPQPGSASPGTSYTLNADTYAVSEDAFAGYAAIFSGDCDTAGHVTLAGGDNKTCTISNDQNPPQPSFPATLHIIKHVINDNGGTAAASSFSLHVKGSGGSGLSDVSGSPAAGLESPGRSYTLAAGTYVVSEDAFSGYASSFSGDCDANGNISLAASDNKTCTITNNDIATPPPAPVSATLHVIKHVVNDSGSTAVASSFSLHVKGSGGSGLSDVSGSPAAGLESPGRSYTLAAGTYVVSEDPFAGYHSSFSGDCDAGGNVTLSSGQDKTCTITNDDDIQPSAPPATLHVIKTVINDNGGTVVASSAVIHVKSGLGDVAGSPQAGAGSPGTSYTLAAGIYNVSENFFAGYAVKVGGDCNDNGDISLVSGDDKTCTITNNDIAGVPPTTTVTTVVPPVAPPPSVPADCDICGKLQYEVYIINPNLTERHSGTAWVRVTDRGNKVMRYSFEDKTLDPKDKNYDYNDAVVDVDYTDCKHVRFLFVSSDADWKHKIRFKVTINGVKQSDTLVTNDSRAVVGTAKLVDATAGVKIGLACPAGAPTLKGKILLQVQQHGEAWYVHPMTGLRYYMKDGPTAYGMMRNFGLGITDNDLATIPSVDSVDALKASQSACSTVAPANAVKGKILLQVQQHGEAWYVDVTKCRRLYMKDGNAAYTLMRFLGLGITDADLAKLTIGL